ncbi:MAG: sigma-70 family RNA polymerase sigma factor [Verrucomicrobia bacterium]|nr:sigma-70 family RNA polymerase sigma factor [Verrucomicrobiota bacterium]
MDSTTDELLMLSVRDGEVENLGVLYERHRGPLFNFFVRLTGSTQAGEDLVHDVFLRMLKYRHTFEARKRFTTWMYQVARNAHFDSWRKRQHEVPLEAGGVDTGEALPSQEPAPDARLAHSQEIALLQEALAGLPVESREVLVLSRFQHLKYEEIATVLDCGVGAVKMRVYRALKELRERFTLLAQRRPDEL